MPTKYPILLVQGIVLKESKIFKAFGKIDKKLKTDGLVPVDSAVFENYRGNCLPDSVSHSQIVDFMTPKSKKEKVYSFYLKICKELAEMNF